MMKKLFRFFALALSACLAVGLFAGCDLFGAGTNDGGDDDDRNGSIEGVWIYKAGFYSEVAIRLYIAEVEGQSFDAAVIKQEEYRDPQQSNSYYKVVSVNGGLARKEDSAYYVDLGEGEAKLEVQNNKLIYTLGDVTTEYGYDSELPESQAVNGYTFQKSGPEYLGRLRYLEDGTQAEFYTDYRGERTLYSVFYVGPYDVIMDDTGNIVYTIGRDIVWKHNFDCQGEVYAYTYVRYTMSFYLGDHAAGNISDAHLIDSLRGDFSYVWTEDPPLIWLCMGDTLALPTVKAAAGYIFTGWDLKEDGVPSRYYGEAGTWFQLTKMNIRFYANYEAIVYDLTYSDGADAEGEVTGMPEAGGTISLESGELTLPAAPHRDGYTFAGWTLNGKTLGETYTLTEEDIPKEGKEIVITAAWTAE